MSKREVRVESSHKDIPELRDPSTTHSIMPVSQVSSIPVIKFLFPENKHMGGSKHNLRQKKFGTLRSKSSNIKANI